MANKKKHRQRIVFVNLHADWMLLRTAMVYIFKFSPAIKHGYILRYLLEHKDEYEVCNYINERGFSLYDNAPNILNKIINKLSVIEHFVTLKVNKIKFSSVTLITNPVKIKDDDIVIMYNICNAGLVGMDKVNGFKVVSMLHFHGRQGEDVLIKNAGVSAIFNEVDLRKTSEIYRQYYDFDVPWIIHPFVPAERFQNNKPFDLRMIKCFSTGTITYKEHEEFLAVYKGSCNQPARKFVKDNPDYFKYTVDCYSSDYLEDNAGKKVEEKDNKLIWLYKKLYNRTHVGKQKKYFSFNMVEKFNEYKMHLVGEEILGVPGIGFVEGMACGSAYIGIDSPMYRDLGLIPGIHYIAYDGTKSGLRKVVEYYQRFGQQKELEQIAKNGCRFVHTNFAGNYVAHNLMESLVALKNQNPSSI